MKQKGAYIRRVTVSWLSELVETEGPNYGNDAKQLGSDETKIRIEGVWIVVR